MVSVLDDDTAGLRLSSDVIRLDENGTKTYTIRLETKPTADVTVTPASTVDGVANTDVVTVLPSSLTFYFRQSQRGHLLEQAAESDGKCRR